MIRMPDRILSGKALEKLEEYQKKVDICPTYVDRIAEAKQLFKQKNVVNNPTFIEVKNTLAEMCCGSIRCNYCEDSKADEIEHIMPKSWYPDKCFKWENYCYVCGPCNTRKNNRFSIRLTDTDRCIDLSRNGDVLPPPDGDPLLINPRGEYPLDFLFLEMEYGQFVYVSMANPGSFDDRRATYTIDTLGLNSRSYLVKARANAYSNFRARLSEYVTRRDQGVSQDELDKLIGNLKEEHHQAVWQEIKRQHKHIDELSRLFASAPEAIEW